MENHVKYGEAIYSHSADGSLFVNLFIPSRLNWEEKGVTIEQQTQLPAGDEVLLSVTRAKPGTSFRIRIRKPHWAGKGIQLTVNGVNQKLNIGDDGYIVLYRNWKTGDKIALTLPESIYTQAIPDNPSRIALFYGPVLLAGELGDKEPDPVSGIPVLVAASADPNQWMKRVQAKQLLFQTTEVGQPGDIKLIPFNQTEKEYYGVYWDLFTPQTWGERQEKYKAERTKAQEEEAHTIDRLRLGEMQPERDHAFTGENLHGGEAHGRQWRSTEDGGYFSFSMGVDSAAANTLICTYWGDDYRGRIFDIQIDGQTIATQNLSSFRQSKFYEISYPLPQELLRGKQTVTVRFVTRSPQNGVGPVSGVIRMVRN
jgi:hypothetical protein